MSFSLAFSCVPLLQDIILVLKSNLLSTLSTFLQSINQHDTLGGQSFTNFEYWYLEGSLQPTSDFSPSFSDCLPSKNNPSISPPTMPAKKQPAFRWATRGNSIAPSLPTPEGTQSTSLIQTNLELVSQELHATVDILQGTLDSLGLASNCTMNTAVFTQSGEDSTQSQLSAHAWSQSVIRADMAKTIEMIQSKMHELHESAQLVVSSQLKLEFPKIVRAVVQNLKENGNLENALQKSENEICENVRLTCLKIEKTSEEYTHINTKKYQEHCTKDLVAQMVKIRTTVTENHQLEKKWHDEVFPLTLESHCNENYLKFQAQVDKVQKKLISIKSM
ncbi:uncharacterized protein MELLADRAFT_59583 [Melampsora larici-populina 98AG31]|uniref:Uncharacterized protein n=1 Tax=Melampsora larici-populina (strain 98AG31 / pathotype 3-4-7) TaxID=747676 RepID=F4R816_MELLP|nr:uncharacterized protein MELLADRAFT_59583 [Melampsora larici-populina 98AG31]EGG11415.1 hypothetical protein MELLADRAFT_59583 [Melampsora larici-populina 98AG31]